MSSAVGADAVNTGVTNDAAYESLSVNIHGFGHQCDPLCGHPDHGLSKPGPNFEGREKAGERYDGEFVHVESMRHAKDMEVDEDIARGGESAIEAIDHDPDKCEIEKCPVCNRITEASLQREVRTPHSGGGGSRCKMAKPGTTVCKVEGCGLTLCEHVRKKSKPGPKAKTHSRVKTVAFKVSASARNGLKQAGIDGELINRLGTAVQHGLTYAEVDAFIARKQDAA